MKDQINTIRAALDMANLGIEDGVATQKAFTALSEIEAMAGEQEPVLKVYKGDICYKSKEDDQSYGMWCPVSWEYQHGLPDGTKFYAAPPAQQYEAGDVASASAQGFRDGVASVTQQEPVAWLYESPMPDGSVFVGASAERLKIGIGVTPDSKEYPLYAAPVAQQPQAEAAPEMHDALCPALTGGDCTCTPPATIDKAWAQFCGGIGRGPDAPYPGMIEAFEAHYGQTFTDKDWREETGVWAAAWKAAKAHGEAAPQQVEAVHRYVLELPDDDKREAKVCWFERKEGAGEITHHLCISVEEPNQSAYAPQEYAGVRCMCVLTGCRAGPGCPHYTDHCKAHIAHVASAPQQAEAVPAPEFNLNTSKGGRGYIEWFFEKVIQRHDFRRYIRDDLAADFACTLARWLRDGAKKQAEAVPSDVVRDAERLDWLLGNGRRMAIDSFGGQYRVVDASCNLVVTDWMPSQRAAIDAAMAQGEKL